MIRTSLQGNIQAYKETFLILYVIFSLLIKQKSTNPPAPNGGFVLFSLKMALSFSAKGVRSGPPYL